MIYDITTGNPRRLATGGDGNYYKFGSTCNVQSPSGLTLQAAATPGANRIEVR